MVPRFLSVGRTFSVAAGILKAFGLISTTWEPSHLTLLSPLSPSSFLRSCSLPTNELAHVMFNRYAIVRRTFTPTDLPPPGENDSRYVFILFFVQNSKKPVFRVHLTRVTSEPDGTFVFQRVWEILKNYKKRLLCYLLSENLFKCCFVE